MTRRAVISDAATVDLAITEIDGVPKSFHYRGHRYVVERVLMHWVEAGPWWQSLRNGQTLVEADDVSATWHIWRVEARSVVGVLVTDLANRICLTSASAYPWRMLRIFD